MSQHCNWSGLDDFNAGKKYVHRLVSAGEGGVAHGNSRRSLWSLGSLGSLVSLWPLRSLRPL